MKYLTMILLTGLCLFGSSIWTLSSDRTLSVSWPSSVIAQPHPQASDFCPALPLTGNIVNVSSASGLVNAVNNASPGDTILIADGTYALDGAYLRITTPNVTLRSASGNREAVVLDGNYLTTEIVQVVASNVTIADLTLREAYYHPIHVMTDGSDTLNTIIYNVHIIDPGEQAIKINPAADGDYPDNGLIACSHIELTAAGRPHIRNNCYTGGVDAHQARDWTIRDNEIEGFWCPNGLSEHGIHLWRGCRDTIVERNTLRDNARGIGFGLAESGEARAYSDNPCPSAEGGYVDHYGGIIRNNLVFASDSSLFSSQYSFDCGICLWQACGAWVGHNTVAATQPPFSGIEWRFDHTDVDIVNNLLTHNLMDRGGTVRLSGNLAYQPLALFVDGAGGDLHLDSTALTAIDQGEPVAAGLCDEDIDGDTRPIGSGRDVGADEYGISAPEAVTDLRIRQAITGTNTLTATLTWSAPADALTTTLRYALQFIDGSSWDSAVRLDDRLAGSSEMYTATVPYAGDTIYFALTTQNEGGRSGISNNAFWPYNELFLPVILK
ncbi:MAG: right-handed parallel beta-helix repeat-containing protein [Anaerolineae bacterium]|nr:right-handed parallel beta-helix repeat-containing protein [Anaerolineae bacterium]